MVVQKYTPYPKPEPENPESPTLGESVSSTAWLFAETKRIFGLKEETIMDIFRTSMMFMQNSAPDAPLFDAPVAGSADDATIDITGEDIRDDG